MTNELSGLGEYTSIASQWGKNVPQTAMKYAMQSAARELMPYERVATCLRFHLPNKDTVTVNRLKTAKKAYFGGLMTCGSVWHCPVCAARISEQRRKDLDYAVKHWTGGMMMVTYTASHTSTTPCATMVSAIIEGIRSFKSGRWFSERAEHYGWLGSVKALEVTTTVNGWHPHCHELVFFTNPLSKESKEAFEWEAKLHWRDVLERREVTASTERGLTMSIAHDKIAEYVTKYGHEPSEGSDLLKRGWGVSHEIAKAAVKTAHEGGRTPNQLLIDYLFGDETSGQLWREYALAFKGKKQMVWGGHIRELLKMQKEQKDAEIAAENPPDSIVYATLDKGQWRLILRHNMRGEIIHNAGIMEPEEFAHWLGNALEDVD